MNNVYGKSFFRMKEVESKSVDGKGFKVIANDN